MEYVQLRNEALQLGLEFFKRRTYRLPSPVRDGNITVVEVDCMTGDMICSDGSVINCSVDHICITTKVYNYILSILK